MGIISQSQWVLIRLFINPTQQNLHQIITKNMPIKTVITILTVQKDTRIMVLQEAIVSMIGVEDQRLEDTTWTTIEYKNKSIFTKYILYSYAFLQKYLSQQNLHQVIPTNMPTKTVIVILTQQKDTHIMVLQEAIANIIEVEDQHLEDTTWTTIEYKNKSILAQYILHAYAFLQKYLNKWKILISSQK